MLLNTVDFLNQLAENKQFNHMKYDICEIKNREEYNRIIELSQQNNIDIYPYLHVLSAIQFNKLIAFKRFYFIFLKKSGYDIELCNTTDLYSTIIRSLEYLLAFIYTIQYFFL
jgi:hypothetical protein